MIIIVVPSLRIYVAKNVLETPQRNAERKDPGLSLVNNPRYMPSIKIYKDIHLVEIIMTQD